MALSGGVPIGYSVTTAPFSAIFRKSSPFSCGHVTVNHLQPSTPYRPGPRPISRPGGPGNSSPAPRLKLPLPLFRQGWGPFEPRPVRTGRPSLSLTTMGHPAPSPVVELAFYEQVRGRVVDFFQILRVAGVRECHDSGPSSRAAAFSTSSEAFFPVLEIVNGLEGFGPHPLDPGKLGYTRLKKPLVAFKAAG